MFSTERDIFEAKGEFIPSDHIAELINVLNLIALITVVAFCFFLFWIM
jgi:hypothetical protein